MNFKGDFFLGHPVHFWQHISFPRKVSDSFQSEIRSVVQKSILGEQFLSGRNPLQNGWIVRTLFNRFDSLFNQFENDEEGGVECNNGVVDNDDYAFGSRSNVHLDPHIRWPGMPGKKFLHRKYLDLSVEKSIICRPATDYLFHKSTLSVSELFLRWNDLEPIRSFVFMPTNLLLDLNL